MNRLIVVVFCFFYILGFGQQIEGQWSGNLQVQGTKLKLVFNIYKSTRGYEATMDSPDQGVTAIPVTIIHIKDSILSLGIDQIGMSYKGVVENDTIIGEFKQSGFELPLYLIKNKTKGNKTLKRPQEIIPSFPYQIEDVLFDNNKDNITLAGTLTFPKKIKKVPAVILISGSGQQNRDSEVYGHKPFFVLSDYLTRKNIAVLRFDDRGVGKSEGTFKNATSFDFAEDVKSAIDYLRNRPEIDNNKIGLIGHSEGGIIASIVASYSPNVSFIILLAGTGIPGIKVLLAQQEKIAETMNLGKDEIEKLLDTNKKIYEIIQENDHIDQQKNKLRKFLVSESESNEKEKSYTDDYIEFQIDQMTTPWFKNFLDYDPADALRNVKCPVLAMGGTKDIQVNSKVNLMAISKALKDGGNRNYSFKELPGLNHLFQNCNTCLMDEYIKLEETFSEEALEIIGSWILKRCQIR